MIVTRCFRLSFPATLLLLAAVGCTSDTTGTVVDSDSGPDFRAFASTLNSLGERTDTFAPGESVTLRLSVVNATDSPRTMTFSSSQRYEFVVEDDGGAEVWRWSLDEVFTPSNDRISFQPRETKQFEEVWPQQAQDGSAVPVGNYLLTGTVTSETPAARSDSHAFSVQ